MHGNNPRHGLETGATHRGETRSGMDPRELSSDDRDSLKRFKASVLTDLKSYLPDSYSVRGEFRITNRSVALVIFVNFASGAQLQYTIYPTPGENTTDDGQTDPSTDGPDENPIGQQLAAVSAQQFMAFDKEHGSANTHAS